MLSERVRDCVGVEVFFSWLLLLRCSICLFLMSQGGEQMGAEGRDVVCMVSDVWIITKGGSENSTR